MDLWTDSELHSCGFDEQDLCLAQTGNSDSKSDDSFTTIMNNYNNYFMSVIVNLGSERQPQELHIDTGSSWTWTYADNCPAYSSLTSCANTRNVFHPIDSDTF